MEIAAGESIGSFTEYDNDNLFSCGVVCLLLAPACMSQVKYGDKLAAKEAA